MKILIVEDEPKTRTYLKQGLVEAGFVCDIAEDGVTGLYQLQTEVYDLAILDVMLPGKDGWSIVEELRKTHRTPVLFLTARDDVDDRVKGLELGGDDYLVKPFDFVELLARVRSLLRRGQSLDSSVLRVEVVDNGPGFAPGATEGHGLRNVSERLAGYFGGEARLGRENLAEGARVWIELPHARVWERCAS